MSSRRNSKDKTEEDDPTLDSGWAWMVAFGCFLEFFISLSQSRAVSVLLLDIVDRMDTRISTLTTMFSMETVAYCVATQVSANWILPRTSVRVIAFTASLANCMCTLTFVLFQNFPVFFVCEVLKVFFQGTMLSNCVALVNAHFLKRRGLATTLALSGVSFSTIVVPPLTRYLREEFGFRGCYLILAGLEMQGVVGALLLRPREKRPEAVQEVETTKPLVGESDKTDGRWSELSLSGKSISPIDDHSKTDELLQKNKHSKKNSGMIASEKSSKVVGICGTLYMFVKSLFDLSIVTNPACVITLIAFAFMNGGRMGEMYVPSLAREVGVSPSGSSTLLTIIGAVSMVTRIGFGFIGDMKLMKASRIICVSSLIMAVLFGFIHFYTTFEVLVAFCVVVGTFQSQYSNLSTLTYLEIMPIDKLAKIMALSTLCSSIFQAVFNVLHGLMIEATGTFTTSFLYNSGCYLVGVVLLVSMPTVDKFARKRNSQDYKAECPADIAIDV